MGYINITSIDFTKSTSNSKQPFELNVKFDCLKNIPHEIEWKFLYVGNPEDKHYDQVLDTIYMNDLNFGLQEFNWEVDSPEYSIFDTVSDIFDSTVIIIIVSLKGKEFFRCSFLIVHEYSDPNLIENPPKDILWEKLNRRIKTDNPVITIKDIEWE